MNEGDFPHLLPFKEGGEGTNPQMPFLLIIFTNSIPKRFIQCMFHSHILCPFYIWDGETKIRKLNFPHLLPLKEGGEGNIPHLLFSLYFLHYHHQEEAHSMQNTTADAMVPFICLYCIAGRCFAAERLYFFSDRIINLPGPIALRKKFCCAAPSDMTIWTNEKHHGICDGILYWLDSFSVILA